MLLCFKDLVLIGGRFFQVVRIEQTETPDMMTERCKSMKNCSRFDKVVRREVCQVTNRGTQFFSQQSAVPSNTEPNYMLAITEKVFATNVCFI